MSGKSLFAYGEAASTEWNIPVGRWISAGGVKKFGRDGLVDRLLRRAGISFSFSFKIRRRYFSLRL